MNDVCGLSKFFHIHNLMNDVYGLSRFFYIHNLMNDVSGLSAWIISQFDECRLWTK